MTINAVALVVVVLLAAPGIVDGFVLRPSRDLTKFTPRRASPVIVKVPPMNSMKSRIASIQAHLPLNRPHERAIFSFYSCVCASFMVLWARKSLNQVQVESFISILWVGMIMGISFLEAWVKFKAPFLRKHVAVDVGRHVFCALNAAELALAASFWIGRVVLAPRVRNAFVLPSLATSVLLVEVLLIAPKLYIRAKYKIVNAAASDGQLLDEEQSALTSVQDEIADKPLPPAKWHFVYVLLESLKVTCLTRFVFTTWTRSS